MYRMYMIGEEYHDVYTPRHIFIGTEEELNDELIWCERSIRGSPWWRELHGPINYEEIVRETPPYK